MFPQILTNELKIKGGVIGEPRFPQILTNELKIKGGVIWGT
jgi:hypothetical protein